MKLQFIFIGKGELPYIGPHTHEVCELVYFLEGKGRTKYGNDEREILPNMFAVYPVKKKHDQTNIEPIRTLCIGISGAPYAGIFGVWHDPGGVLKAMGERLLREVREKRPYGDMMIQGLLREIGATVLRTIHSPEEAAEDKDLIQKAVDIISATRGMISVRGLADELFISRDYLSHLFKEKQKVSTIEYIISSRIENAKSIMLSSPAKTIKEVSHECGFSDVYYFSKIFKKYSGKTPTQFRQNLHH